MTRDDIIRMAHEAQGEALSHGMWSMHIEDLERFAALVATHEREEYALICDANLIAAHEREECARICDELDRRWINQAEKCAERIRARGE